METIFQPPPLTGWDETILEQIAQMREELSQVLRAPRRWQGTLRRAAQAKAIQGSNSIEGYSVSDQDAAAAVDNEPASEADEGTWAEIVGYRRVMTYILNVGTDPSFTVDESALRSMHFMLLEHELAKAPGRYRTGPMYVLGPRGIVYTAPDAEWVNALVAALIAQTHTPEIATLVKAALAHLNLVMIHPFKDGNGRMGRALQTLVLAQDSVLEPAFSSIEEWLGANTADYYSVLALTGAEGWHPQRSTLLWVRFNLRAHHMQAQTVRRRFQEASQYWSAIDDLMSTHSLPERMSDSLFDALLGWRVTRPSYIARAGTDERTATRDLTRLADLGLLSAHGQTKGRSYIAGPTLDAIRDQVRLSRVPLVDPYPDLIADIHSSEAALAKNPGGDEVF